ncbi:hypothetical protein [Thiosulfativibrio zosterae]|uniref:Uncharacterized protein n=1 Tax=Thiosulfativibrio zosterae TaxID=2675053 RepID=A0A6F8PQZ5_9GAMM|nr:hypothetical protein [Thiosulfativibrio zosterae]BBP44552.1 hypothetical protein THMIRHAT_22980 [Thiosulfativibrio zosterae]
MNTHLLTQRTAMDSIASLTKKHHTQCQASNMAFFVPKIDQAWLNLTAFVPDVSMKNRNHISQYGRVKARIKDLAIGNKCSRVMRLSDTRPPETKTGGHSTKKHHGGQTMPLNTSKTALICRISTTTTPNGIQANIHTRYNQTARVGRLFASLEQLKAFIQAQGLKAELLAGGAL